MTQEEERKYATLMVKVYEWLTEFQNEHEAFTFMFKSKGKHLFCGRGKGKVPEDNRFYVNLRPECTQPRCWFSLSFYVDLEFTRISKVDLHVAYGSKESISRLRYKQFVQQELNGGDQLTSTHKIAGPSTGQSSEEDVKNGLLAWLGKHYDALIEALKDDSWPRTDFEKDKSKRIKALCEKGVLQEKDGRLSIPDDAQFDPQGEPDEENMGIENNGIQRKEIVTIQEEIRKLLIANFNIVLTGAPGTGKTYTAREVAKELVCDGIEDGSERQTAINKRIRSIQFHPGYDYSDFVIGMKPKLIGEKGKEQVAFDWESGVFKKFADDAKTALHGAKERGEEPPKFVFIIDEINRADLSRVFGELFSLLEEEYRYPRNKNGIRLPNGVSFVIPENLYIIGTMNDIDRSVESMDFALRRRFAWREVKARETMDAILGTEKNPNPKIDPDSASKLKVAMKALNERISGTKDLECSLNGGKENINIGAFLGSAYELGAAIFAKFAKCSGDFNMLWENHIKIILAEYLRGRRNPEKFLDALKDVYDKAVKDEEASR